MTTEPKFKVGDKVWDRLHEQMTEVRLICEYHEVFGHRYYVKGDCHLRLEKDLARKEPSVQIFQARETDDEFLERVSRSAAARPSSSRFPIFRVAELVSGPEPIGKRFFVVETTLTSDGPRDRICDGRWDTEQQAQDECARRKERANGKV